MRKITAVLLILTMLLCTAATQGESESRTAPILLTSFDCTDLEGNPVDITLFDGAQLVLLDIWEAWCDWCLLEMPDLCELYELNKYKGFMVVGLSGVASAEGFDAKTVAENLGITYPLVHGTAEMLPCAVEGFPMTLVYQRQEDSTLELLGAINGYMPRENWNRFMQEFFPGAVTEAEAETKD